VHYPTADQTGRVPTASGTRGRRPNRTASSTLAGANASVGAEFVGLDLYNQLKEFFRAFVDNVLQVYLCITTDIVSWRVI
jgi:hypothetical protein